MPFIHPSNLRPLSPSPSLTPPKQQVIAEAILSLSPEESDQTFAHMYLPIVTEGNLRTWYPYRAYLPTPANFAYHRHVAVLNAYITSIIEKRCVRFCGFVFVLCGVWSVRTF